ncbi:hypothetical protein LP52_11380 [Streptomonospora alba]|uniref:Uncharacterized protein n=1 Tax=Streptomonospora alba TaxID=183763 RepID=A0A0C2JPK7_9ACTN|nr:hypothetical protein [Streptomonospora alba]KIH98737.1 hypothetical protein LP52_11380 [Streptomonospora alba]
MAVAALAVTAASGCTAEQRSNLFGGIAAEGLRVAAEEAFASAGFPIEGQLDCQVEESDSSQVTADCSGTTQQGADVDFNGRFDSSDTNFTDGVDGQFTGKVQGETVFSTDCLGCGGGNGGGGGGG